MKSRRCLTLIPDLKKGGSSATGRVGRYTFSYYNERITKEVPPAEKTAEKPEEPIRLKPTLKQKTDSSTSGYPTSLKSKPSAEEQKEQDEDKSNITEPIAHEASWNDNLLQSNKDSLKHLCLFKRNKDNSFTLDWPVFVQTRHRLLEKFTHAPHTEARQVFSLMVYNLNSPELVKPISE